MSKEKLLPDIQMYFSAGILVVVGFGILHFVTTSSGIVDYPYVRVAAGMFGFFSISSGVGIWAKRHWVRWALLMLLVSMYSVFTTTYFARGDTSRFILVFAVFVLPIAAYVFWRAVKRFVSEAT